jgi:hypothetical protein
LPGTNNLAYVVASAATEKEVDCQLATDLRGQRLLLQGRAQRFRPRFQGRQAGSHLRVSLENGNFRFIAPSGNKNDVTRISSFVCDDSRNGQKSTYQSVNLPKVNLTKNQLDKKAT